MDSRLVRSRLNLLSRRMRMEGCRRQRGLRRSILRLHASVLGIAFIPLCNFFFSFSRRPPLPFPSCLFYWCSVVCLGLVTSSVNCGHCYNDALHAWFALVSVHFIWCWLLLVHLLIAVSSSTAGSISMGNLCHLLYHFWDICQDKIICI